MPIQRKLRRHASLFAGENGGNEEERIEYALWVCGSRQVDLPFGLIVLLTIMGIHASINLP